MCSAELFVLMAVLSQGLTVVGEDGPGTLQGAKARVVGLVTTGRCYTGAGRAGRQGWALTSTTQPGRAQNLEAALCLLPPLKAVQAPFISPQGFPVTDIPTT